MVKEKKVDPYSPISLSLSLLFFYPLPPQTGISTKGCWNVVPGLYQMADGSVCRPPAGSNVTAVPTVVSPTGTAPTASGGVTVPVTTGAGAAPTGSTGSGSSGSGSGSSTTKPSLTSGNSSSSGAAGGLVASNVEVLGALAAAAVALAVGF